MVFCGHHADIDLRPKTRSLFAVFKLSNGMHLLARPKRFELLTPRFRSLMTPITHPIVRAPMAGRGIVRGARIVAWRLKRPPT